MAAFALFKFVQSVGSAIAFLYSTTLNLHHQLYLLALIGSMATVCYCLVEWNCRSKVPLGMEKSDSQQDIVANNNNLVYHQEQLKVNKSYNSITKGEICSKDINCIN